MSEVPVWLKKKVSYSPTYLKVKAILKELGVVTVCQSSLCPNINECFNRPHATFMILGNICTRNCKFCAVDKGVPKDLDHEEPLRIKEAVARLSLKHVIITSVTRDDLHDGGAAHFAYTIREIKKIGQDITVEVLTPDFKGRLDSIETVVEAVPDVFGHNIETVPRLYSLVRPKADYSLSLKILETVKEINKRILTKSGLMLGLGEKVGEVLQVIKDLKDANCDMLTFGQYLKPGKYALPICEFISPSLFFELKNKAISYGFKHVESGPFVRSSYCSNRELLEGYK